VDKNDGRILSRLCRPTKVHEISADIGIEALVVIFNALPRLSMAYFVPKIFAIKALNLGVVKNNQAFTVFFGPNILSRRITPTFTAGC